MQPFMKTFRSPPLTRFVVRGGWLALKSTFNSVIATLVLVLALVASLAH
jgi:hypothetical protein